MPVNPTFPGVYIEEIPSGVRTITGVATSITAFVGRALRGPVNQATTITSFSDFERTFGGLGVDYPMSYAVRDFFLNGGSQAIIVRLVHKDATGSPPTTPAATAFLDLPAEAESPPASPPGPSALKLVAANPGSWPNKMLAVAVDHKTKNPTDPKLFNLTFTFTHPDGSITTEQFLNVSTDDTDPRYVPRVLKQSSSLVRVKRADQPTDPNDPWQGNVPDVRPADTPIPDPKASPPITLPTFDDGNDGDGLDGEDYLGSQADKTGIFALEQADLFNLLCIPADKRGGDTSETVYQNALEYCVSRRAMLIVDPPAAWSTGAELTALLSNPGTKPVMLHSSFRVLEKPTHSVMGKSIHLFPVVSLQV
jgi:hypothetical protein